jgi:hypothetical protein
MSKDPIQKTLATRRPPRLSPHFTSRLMRSLPEARGGVSASTKAIGGVAVLTASLLLALMDWPQWLSVTAILLSPLAALALLAPSRIAAGIVAVFVVLLREADKT